MPGKNEFNDDVTTGAGSPADPDEGPVVKYAELVLPVEEGGRQPFLGNMAGYRRVSDPNQARDGTSLDTQGEELMRYAADQGYQMRPEWLFTDVVTGASTVRRGFTELLEFLDTGVIDAVSVYDPDRLARDPLVLLTLSNEILERGVSLEFLRGPSGDSDEAQMMRVIMAYAAKRERAQIAERTMRAKRRVARNGRMPVGVGGNGIYGYDYDTVTQIRTVNEVEAAVVVMMFEWYVGGWSTYAISEELNRRGLVTKRGKLWHPRTVRNILTHTSYVEWDVYGKYRCQVWFENQGKPNEKKRIKRTLRPESEWEWIYGFSPRITEDDLWGAAQARLAMPSVRTGNQDLYLLTGYTRCSVCGQPVNGGSKYNGRRRYRCQGTQKRGKLIPKTCSASYIPADELEAAVWGGLVNALKNPVVLMADLEEHFDTGGGDVGPEIRDLKKAVGECEKQESRLREVFSRDHEYELDQLMRDLAPIRVMRSEHQRELERLERQREVAGSADECKALVQAKLEELSVGLEELDFDGKRQVMGALDMKVKAVLGDVSMSIVVGFNPTTIGRTSA